MFREHRAWSTLVKKACQVPIDTGVVVSFQDMMGGVMVSGIAANADWHLPVCVTANLSKLMV